MNDWTAGYVADIGYTFGYYHELNPLRIKLAFINAGLVFPQVGTACELGFGQGVSVNIHAAASVTQWHGTDFNPAQAAFAQELATVAGSGARLFDDAFAEFAQRPELPDFDYIALHGIWSWISDDNRAVIVDFIRRKLKVGGVLYVSYNTLPGWAAFAPMRHLMTEHAEVIGSEGRGIVSRVNDALDFAERLLATNPRFLRANPLVGDRVQQLKEQSRDYLAHEYFNRDWHPMHFATMADWLAPAKLSYACSAHYLDHIDLVNLTNEQQRFLAEVPDAMLRQSVRDFMVNQQFRKDYWVKGARALSAIQRLELLYQQRVLLITYRPDVKLSVSGALGEGMMNEAVYDPILDAMADHRVRSIAELAQALRDHPEINMGQILQAMMALAGAGHVVSAQDDAAIAAAKQRTAALNAYLLDRSRSQNDVKYLASPVTGGGIDLGQIEQLYLLGHLNGKGTPQELAQFVWSVLLPLAQGVVRDGQPLTTAEDNIAELTSKALVFQQQRLPILRGLQIA